VISFEYPTVAGVVELFHDGQSWAIRYAGRRASGWQSADAAARAVASHQTGCTIWDRRHVPVPADLLDWRPTGDSI
jgi:hypothetical protein